MDYKTLMGFSLYTSIYDKSLKICDDIRTKFPTFESDTNNFTFKSLLIQDNPLITNDELLAHMFTINLLIEIMLTYSM